MLQNELFDNVVKDFNAGYWELHNDPNKEVWSKKFYHSIGYQIDEIESSIDYFLEHLIHKEDIDAFRNNFINYKKSNLNFKQHVKICSKSGDYKLFRCATNDQLPVNIKSEVNLIFFFEIKLEPEQNLAKDNFYYKETAQMTATGSWKILHYIMPKVLNNKQQNVFLIALWQEHHLIPKLKWLLPIKEFFGQER